MATFASFNTDDATSGQTPLTANGTTIVGPFSAGVAAKLAGSLFADVSGTAYVEQSFDGGNNWDISQSIAVPAGQGAVIDVDVLAPIMRVRYVNGASNQAHLRIFARAFGNRGG